MPLPRIIGKAWSAFRVRYWAWFGVTALVLAFGVALRQSSSEADFYSRWGVDPANLPYQSDVDPRTAIELGKARAADSGKMLMVTFGANWCPDCLTLHKNLRDPVTRDYAERRFEMVHIDVGDSAKTARVQHDLGIPVSGIPLAVFYSADGRPICDTLAGELVPSRHFTSREILDFLREVADFRRVVSPDQRQ
jgi:thioredoxin 1